ncbi:YkgJ family cysteine cluster protein [uncultured Desulfosarcina sp.]|uniref:YkgJ family cysteine cluster protein n=1 Tax=uncultured Desulfosarcina sp. TaxID=218289 RepID=UPI0029C65274|nr:YkgJ family cysteine cluster protein [uncultured Desulfosarcina sp.]
MELNAKLTLLERMVDIYDWLVDEFDLACEKYCAHCCTANVTMTTLEGYRILNHLEKTGETRYLETIARQAHPDRFSPCISINRMADICAQGGDPPDEHLNPDAGPCPVLTDDTCPLYPVRPFGCRCMVSASNCGRTGFADMDPFILTVNDVFLQHLEHIDAQGYTGNFVDVMQFLESDENRQNYTAGRLGAAPDGLVANQPVFVLMIPPEHRERIQFVLKQIRSIQM